MAGEQELDIVKISYEDIKRIVLSSRSDSASPKFEHDRKENSGHQSQSKPKRPSQQIYRPGSGRHNSGRGRQNHGASAENRGNVSNNERASSDRGIVLANDTTVYDKGNISASERAVSEEEGWEAQGVAAHENVQKGLDNLHIDSPPCDLSEPTDLVGGGRNSEERVDDDKDQSKKRRPGKRPDMQVYVPRARLGQRDRKSEEKEISSPTFASPSQDVGKENRDLELSNDEEQIIIPNKSDHQRKVQNKGRGMKVTVLKESPSSAGSQIESAELSGCGVYKDTEDIARLDGKAKPAQKNHFDKRRGSQQGSQVSREKNFGPESNVSNKDPDGNTGSSSRIKGLERNSEDNISNQGQVRESQDVRKKQANLSDSQGGRKVYIHKDENNETQKSDIPNRRSNSNDSRSDKKDKRGKEPEQIASRTFPRTKGAKPRSAKNETFNQDKGARELGNRGGRGEADKFYWGMRRQRTGSISSEASAASNNGSIYSGSSDFTEDDEPEHILDWGAEVEKAHLEAVARLVNDGAQRLTSSLDTYPTGATQVDEHLTGQGIDHLMSMSADNMLQKQPQSENIRPPRRRNKHRKNSSRQGSRDSSVHSSIHGDDNASERSHRRRRRHRRSPRNSQQDQNEAQQPQSQGYRHNTGSDSQQAGPGKRPGLQVTVGQNNRHVELSPRAGIPGRRRHISNEMSESYTVDSSAEDWDRDIQHNMARSWRDEESTWQEYRHSQTKSPRVQRKGFVNDDGGKKELISRGDGGGDSRGDKGQHNKGKRDRQRQNTGDNREDFGKSKMTVPQERGKQYQMEEDHKHSTDKRSVHPAYDASAGLNSNRGRGRGQSRYSNNIGRDQHGNQQVSGRGLLRMPVSVQTEHNSAQSSVACDRLHKQGTEEHAPPPALGSSNTRGPLHGTKHLFDPNNPSKPIVIAEGPPAPLKFEEVGSGSSPTAGTGTSPTTQDIPHVGPPRFPYPGAPIFPHDYPSMYQGYRPRMPPPHFMPPGHYMGGYPAPPPHMFYGYPPMPPYYKSPDVEGDMMSSASRSQSRVMAEQLLRDSNPFDCQLGNIMSRRPLSEESIRMLNQIREELQSRLERVILLDIEVASKHNVEQALWKSVYYQVIEAHRRRMAEEKEPGGSSELMKVLDEGTHFFESLLKKLETTYEFDLDMILEMGAASMSEGCGRHTKLALLCTQRVMMFLGDISRYREQSSDSTNYGKARQWYLKAQKIHPRNGRPYNQLAILAVYTRRKLDAVYYYMRSLAASNPILTARESLMSIFDEVRRKVDAVEKKRFEERQQRVELKSKHRNHGTRVEVWILPDGTSSTQDQDRDTEFVEEDLSTLSAVELNKRFVLTYLNVHGKLFTKINFEVFAESCSLMLQEFENLIQRSPCVFSSTRLLQLMAINMFSIDNTALKDESLEESCRSLLQEHAVETALDIFGLLVRRCAELMELQQQAQADGCPEIRGHVNVEDPIPGGWSELLSEDLHNILPALKTWVDWMMCHASLWNPQPFNRPPDLGPQIDVWENLARFCDLLNSVETRHGCLIREQKPGYEAVILQEDTTLSGFVPMLSAPQEIFYADASVDKRQAEDWLRIEKLRLFGEYLCGVEPPMLGYSVETGRYYSLAPKASQSEEKLHEGDNPSCDKSHSGDESDDVEIEYGDSDNDGIESGNVKDDIVRLKNKKAELKKKRLQRDKVHESREAILDSHKHAKIELEIRPTFLIPDTNCFIDHFSSLQKILHSKKYTLVLPLVVINELEGLARGARPTTSNKGGGWSSPEDQAEHARLVQTQAQAAMSFLEAEFETKNPNLRSLTSRGTVLETIAFRSEEASHDQGINDDIILNCCLHYCKDMARDFMPKDRDQPVHLLREVVLLTEDRNLRLKAHTHNVPVRDVPRFKRWSKII